MKLCIDCKFYEKGIAFDVCMRPTDKAVSLVGGEIKNVNVPAGICDIQRFGDIAFGYCGSSAVYFQPREVL